MKRCFKCFAEKPLDEFYKHSSMKDGVLGKCKECTKADVKNHREKNLKAVRAYDRSRGNLAHRVAAREAYSKTESFAKSHEASIKRWAAAHPDRKRAASAVSNAIRDGKLIPWPVCALPECSGKPQGHHPDYSRPLDVVWLCIKHHKEVHAMVRKTNL